MEDEVGKTETSNFLCVLCKKGEIKILTTYNMNNKEVGYYEGKSYRTDVSRKIVAGKIVTVNEVRFAVCSMCLGKDPQQKIFNIIRTTSARRNELEKEHRALIRKAREIERQQMKLLTEINKVVEVMRGTYFPWDQIEFDK